MLKPDIMNTTDARLAGCLVFVLLLMNCAGGHRVLSVHLADYSDGPAAGRIRVDMPQGEAPLYAEATPVLDERDFRSVSFARDQSGLPTLSLCFAPASRVKFTRVMKNNVHRRLVFLIRGKLLFAPVIDSEAVLECATVQGFVSEEDAAALQRAIR